MEEVSVELTFDELVVLSSMLGLELPVGVLADDVTLPAGVRERLQAASRSGLLARRIVDQGVVNRAIASLLELASNPLLVVNVELEVGPMIDTVSLACDTDLGVELREFAPRCYRFTPFVTRDLSRRVARHADLRPSVPAQVEPFTLDHETIASAVALAFQDSFGAKDLLVAAGVADDTATVFAEALADHRRTVAVTALHRPTEDTVEGGTISWLDCGIRGNWMSEGDDDLGDAANFLIKPITAEQIETEILSYLPWAFPSEPEANGN